MQWKREVSEVKQRAVQRISKPEKDSTCCWLEDGVGPYQKHGKEICHADILEKPGKVSPKPWVRNTPLLTP